MKHICSVCAYVYDDEIEGVPFDELPDDWVCPICTADKSFFEVEGGSAGGSAQADGHAFGRGHWRSRELSRGLASHL